MTRAFRMIVCVTALLCLVPGCLITRHNTNVIRKNEEPKVAQFESPQAKNLFDAKVAEARAKQTGSHGRVFAVPFLLWYSSADVVSDNGVYNDQLAICDANGDGYVSLQESQIYSARIDATNAPAATAVAGAQAPAAPLPPDSPRAVYPVQPVSVQTAAGNSPPSTSGR